jgi:uncharacterized protein YrrD
MLQNIKKIYEKKLVGLDGDIGHVKDIYFDDESWAIRYLVADTGTWLAERLVLLSPHAFSKRNHDENTLHLKLHKKQIEDSPPIDSKKPVSRQFEEEYHHYYAWPSYWLQAPMVGIAGYSAVMPPSQELPTGRAQKNRSDSHLQSAKAITGYHVQEVDGTVGHITGFIIDDKNWAIHALVVETGHWYLGKEILIPPSKIERISITESKVVVNVTRAEIQRTAEDHLAKAGGAIHVPDKFYG